MTLERDGGTVTVLRALPFRSGGVRPTLAKRWRTGRDGEPFSLPVDDCRWFEVHERQVDGLAALEALLRNVERCPSAAVIRGAPLPGTDHRRTERLANPADDRTATFAARPRQWLMVDVDSLPDPPGDTMRSDPEACVEHTLCRLPDELAEASCWWQASGSAGFKPGVRLHLWFWLSRPISDAEAAGWLAAAPVDRALYWPVQLHYVAASVLLGLADPLPRRSGRRLGLDDVVAVPATLPMREEFARGDLKERVAALRQGLRRGVDDGDLQAVQAAVRRSRLVQQLWRGERSYSDRSAAHFAVVSSLVKAGLDDDALLARVLVAVDRRLGWRTDKSSRPDYVARTIDRAKAAGAGAHA